MVEIIGREAVVTAVREEEGGITHTRIETLGRDGNKHVERPHLPRCVRSVGCCDPKGIQVVLTGKKRVSVSSNLSGALPFTAHSGVGSTRVVVLKEETAYFLGQGGSVTIAPARRVAPLPYRHGWDQTE